MDGSIGRASLNENGSSFHVQLVSTKAVKCVRVTARLTFEVGGELCAWELFYSKRGELSGEEQLDLQGYLFLCGGEEAPAQLSLEKSLVFKTSFGTEIVEAASAVPGDGGVIANAIAAQAIVADCILGKPDWSSAAVVVLLDDQWPNFETGLTMCGLAPRFICEIREDVAEA